MSASDNEILASELNPSTQLALPEHSSPLPGILISIGRWLGNRQTQVRRRARELKNEYPLRLAGALMGSAFIFGVAIRVWSGYKYDR